MCDGSTCDGSMTDGGRPGGDAMSLNGLLEPGMLVRHPGRPEWGTGQVQSNVGGRVTVTFPEAGKVVFDGDHVTLMLVPDP